LEKCANFSSFSYRRIPGNASPKMELYNGQISNDSDTSPSSSCNGSTFVYEEKIANKPVADAAAGLSAVKNGFKSTAGKGPDFCVAAEKIWTTEPGTPVTLRIGR
jgi:hypothetical protein